MEDKEIKELFSKISVPAPEEEFESELASKLETRAQRIFVNKKKSKSIFLPWQMSLVFASFGIVLMLFLVIVASPSTVEKIKGYVQQDAYSALSNEVVVSVAHKDQNLSIFIFNLLESNKPPLDIPLRENSETIDFSLYPGRYRIVFVIDGMPVSEEEITVKLGQENLNIDKNWALLLEKTENEE